MKGESWPHEMPMETAEILHQFERATGKFARAAVEAAVARREEVTPELLRILEETVDRAAEIDAEGDYMAHLYAMFLLAQFRETRAYPLVVRFASLPGDLLDSLCGDFITEDLGQVLASVCGGELAGIQSLIENEGTDEWVRGAALSGLVTLVAAGQKSRDEIVSYFAGLFRGKLVRQWSHVWDTLVSYSSDLYPEELLDDIERAYDEGLVDPGYIGFDDVKRDLALGKDRILARLADDPHRRLVEDTVAEMGWWACFREDSPNSREKHSAGLGKGRPKSGGRASSQIKSGNAEDRQERTMPVRERQEIQEVLWRMKFWGRELVLREMRCRAAPGGRACQASHIPRNLGLINPTADWFESSRHCKVIVRSGRLARTGFLTEYKLTGVSVGVTERRSPWFSAGF